MEELLKSSLEVRGVLMAPQLDGAPRGVQLRETITKSGIDFTSVSEAEFRSAAETESPQGILAIGAIPERKLESLAEVESLRILILDAVQDPGNVGTLVRTAAALGVDATVALPGTVDLWNAKVIRGAMGAIYNHHALSSSLEDLLAFLQAQKIELWGGDAAGKSVGELRPPPKMALAVGNEGAGLSSSLRERVAQTVSLPISASVESLNVAVAAGILLYQLRK